MNPLLEVLSRQEIEAIHRATLEVLESAGMEFRHPEALALLRGGGARVEGSRVYFNRAQLTQALETAPERFLLEARNPGRSVWIGGATTVFAPPAGCVYVQDLGAVRRQAVLKDYLNLVRLIHQSPHFDTNGGGLVIPEIPGFSEQETFALLILAGHWYSDKPQMGLTLEGEIVRTSLEVSEIIFQRRPGCYLLGTVNPDSPLIYSEKMLESLLLYARAGQGLILAPCSMAMATSPTTLAGTLVQNNAEILAGVVLTQLVNPGTPVVYGNTSTISDMKTMSIALGAPELSLLVGAVNQLARYYNLPSRTGGALTDAKSLDFQAGMESVLSMVSTVASQTNVVLHSAGILDSFLTISLEKLVLDEEIGGMARRFRQGLNVNEDTLAVAEICSRGPGGHFLDTNHTLNHFRQEFWHPRLCDRQAYVPQRDYRSLLGERAHKIWQDRIAAYLRPALPAGVEEELLDYYQRKFHRQPEFV
ncbi:trimethylamine methyltransferase family protein [Desulfosporosinus sp. PR]|uniref:trimethylamine methyltransferase family protein n=1 Tax=Candidatus Desulfosporosinus nitrosoreducens TaxID=3401928 RepID=UPI0027F27B3B|nr:trimethylamine methyltransferase family protein [Desulfosporosinus sp. PR]MDQ7096329.1 trimethylamine methyltransferase family protein [Desulfosporosinus sp. PR]